jgi:hypothetical protein
MMKIPTGHAVKTLRPGDDDFTFSPDGIQIVSRAGFEISNNCPAEYKSIFVTAINAGWLKPVAYMRDVEYTVELLRK